MSIEPEIIDCTEEMKDLKKIYEDSLKDLKESFESRMGAVVYEMRRFVKLYDEMKDLEDKMEILDGKMSDE